MARKPRIKIPGTAAGYHVVTRVRGREFLLDLNMKNSFVKLMHKLKALYYVRYAAFSILDNHYHLLLRFEDPENVDPFEAMTRWNAYHEGTVFVRNAGLETHRHYVVQELTDLSSFMKRFNYHLTLSYNLSNKCTGTLWERRYRSSVVERGTATILCAAYIELNAFRAGLTGRPEEYDFSGIACLRNGNADHLIDTALLAEGLGLAGEEAGLDEFTSIYLAYIYTTGSTSGRSGAAAGMTVTEEMQVQLAKYGLKPAKGRLALRLNALINGKVIAGPDLAQQVYETYINPGLTGLRRVQHMGRWVQNFIGGLWSVCSTAARGRGSP